MALWPFSPVLVNFFRYVVNGGDLPRLSLVRDAVRFLMSAAFPTDGEFPRNSDASQRRPKAPVGYKARQADMLHGDRRYNNNYWKKKAAVTKE